MVAHHNTLALNPRLARRYDRAQTLLSHACMRVLCLRAHSAARRIALVVRIRVCRSARQLICIIKPATLVWPTYPVTRLPAFFPDSQSNDTSSR